MLVAITPEEFQRWGTIIGVLVVGILAGIPAFLRGYRETQARGHKWNVHPVNKVCPNCGSSEYKQV